MCLYPDQWGLVNNKRKTGDGDILRVSNVWNLKICVLKAIRKLLS
jgi:hypothetical protein